MASKLQVVSETEVPDPRQPEPASPPPAPPKVIETPSKTSSPASPHILLLLDEIRKVLSARMGALLAMGGAMLLTAAAMMQQTWMGLAIAATFDVLVFLPLAIIAYGARQ